MEHTNTQNLIRLASIAANLPQNLQEAIEEKAAKFFEDLNEDVGKFLCSSDLDSETQSEDDIRTLIQCVPGALGSDNDYNLAIHWACTRPGSVPFIPLLAEEGLKLNVFGEGMRGGLLWKHGILKDNVLQKLLYYHREDDAIYFEAIRRLREMGLFVKEDIQEFNLGVSYGDGNPKRFHFLADWDPITLRLTNDYGYCTLHKTTYGVEPFKETLTAALRHYPEEIGLLMYNVNKRAYDTPMSLARHHLGRRESWKIIKKCLDNSDHSRIIEKDKTTNLYPFMLAAAGDCYEMNLLYYLTRLNPIALVSNYEDRCMDIKNDAVDSDVHHKKKKLHIRGMWFKCFKPVVTWHA